MSGLPSRSLALIIDAAMVLVVLCVGCGEDIPVSNSRSLGPSPGVVDRKSTGPGSAEQSAHLRNDSQFGEDDFVETQSNRDPFRTFIDVFVSRLVTSPQRAVVMSNASIDEMRLVALVNGNTEDYAMVIDNAGVGYTLRRGDYVGRSEVVQVGGPEGVPVTLNWRVDRIRADALILSREDPMGPNKPPLVKVIPLHESGHASGRGAP